MEYYSVRATDIQLKKMNSSEGWHIGDELNYLLTNGSWTGQVKLQSGFSEYGVENFIAQIIYLAGDKEKLLRDYDIIFLILREKLHNQNISLMKIAQL
jgi:hypothetical protein